MNYPATYGKTHINLGLSKLSQWKIEGLAKRDLVVLTPGFIEDIEGVHAIKERNPEAKVCVFWEWPCVVFSEPPDTLHIPVEMDAFKDKGAWWLTRPGTLLAEEAGSNDETLKLEKTLRLFQASYRREVNHGPIESRPILVCEDELMLLKEVGEREVKVVRGYLGTKAESHRKGTRIAEVTREGWDAGDARAPGKPFRVPQLNMTDLAPLLNGTRPNLLKTELLLEHYYSRSEWREAFDGVYWDCCGSGRVSEGAGPLDLNRDNVAEDPVQVRSLWWKGLVTHYKYNRSKTATDFLLWGNGLDRLIPEANGMQMENFVGHGPRQVWADAWADYRGWMKVGHKPSLFAALAQYHRWTDYRDMRLSFCSILLSDGYYQNRSPSHPLETDGKDLGWYDEFWVDEEGNPSGDPKDKGWLGQPKGESVQVLSPLVTPNALEGVDWALNVNTKYGEASLDSKGNRLNVHIGLLREWHPTIVKASARGAVTLNGNSEFTLSLEGKASKPLLITFTVKDEWGRYESQLTSKILLETEWETHVISLARYGWSQSWPLHDWVAEFLMGGYEADISLRNISLQEGLREVGWKREYENGLVLVNPTYQKRTFTELGDGVYQRIRGKQDPEHNNGELVRNTLDVLPRDGFILLRKKH